MHAPPGQFLNFNSQSPFSWVSESSKHDIGYFRSLQMKPCESAENVQTIFEISSTKLTLQAKTQRIKYVKISDKNSILTTICIGFVPFKNFSKINFYLKDILVSLYVFHFQCSKLIFHQFAPSICFQNKLRAVLVAFFV